MSEKFLFNFKQDIFFKLFVVITDNNNQFQNIKMVIKNESS